MEQEEAVVDEQGMIDRIVAQVKSVCCITWEDDATDERLKRMVGNSVIDICGKVGIPKDAGLDLSVPGRENELIVMRCFYDWNAALDEFEGNYRSLIMSARARWEVMADVSEDAEASPDIP